MRRILASALLLAACGDNREPLDDLPADAGPDAGPVGRTLTGDQTASFRALDGTVHDEVPTDLWDTVFEAHAPAAGGAGWQVIPGAGHRDGSFAIDGVPEESVWLRVARRPAGDSYFWTDADHVSFSEPVLGPEVPPSALDGDQLIVDVDGLAPWQEGDGLAWLVPDDVIFDLNLVQIDPPAPGATAIDGTEVQWTFRSLASADAGEGYLVQYRLQELAGLPVLMPVRAASPPLTQTAGVDATLTATLTAPPMLGFRLAWARDLFEAERATIHPDRAGASAFHGMAFTAFPAIVEGEVWIAPEYPLVQFQDPSLLSGTDLLDLGDVEVPNPFPRSWITASFIAVFPVDLPMPDGTPFTLEATIFTRDTELPTAEAPAAPAITPARSPTVEGVAAYDDLDGVGLTPEIAWEAPATGTATAYQLQIIEAIENPPFPYQPGWYLAAELWVSADRTSLRVPADVLRPGVTYAAILRSHAQPGQDIATRPFRNGAVAAFADTVLGRFTP